MERQHHATPDGPVPYTDEEQAAYEAQQAAWAAGALDRAKAAKSAAVQAEKVRARDAGFIANGVLWDSDQSARVSYSEIALKLLATPTFATPWKASQGVWVTMDAATYAAVSSAGETHVQNVFAWQAARDAEIAAATTVEAVQAVSEHYA